MTLPSDLAKPPRTSLLGPGIALGQVEQSGVHLLAEILRKEEFGQADDVGPITSGLLDEADGPVKIRGRALLAAHLDQAEGETIGWWHLRILN